MGATRRAVAGLTTLVVGGVLLGCGDVGRAPTEPSLTPTSAAPSFAALTETTSERIPIAIVVNACGQLVPLSGDLHILSHVTISPSGNIHFKSHANPQGVSGETASGVKYQGTGVTQSQLNINGPLPVTFTFVNNFRIIGQGAADNFLVHANFHVTINANGDVTTVVDNFSTECQG